MKTSKDPRHIKRVSVMQELFAWDFQKDAKKQTALVSPLAKRIVKSLPIIDGEIQKSATSWPIQQINKIDLAILRLAIYELLIENGKTKGKTPYKVIVDEAVELSKEYGSESSPSFVNGVLGKVIEGHQDLIGE